MPVDHGLALYGLLFAPHTSFAFVRLFRSVRGSRR